MSDLGENVIDARDQFRRRAIRPIKIAEAEMGDEDRLRRLFTGHAGTCDVEHHD